MKQYIRKRMDVLKRVLSMVLVVLMIFTSADFTAFATDGTLDSPVINGKQVTFYYEDPNASTVSLRGDMNGWGETSMTKNGNVFSLTLELDPGEYGYKFYVNNSEWKQDPLNDLYSGDNSKLVVPGPIVVGKQVTFYYKNANASTVTLRGSMNGWGETSMTKNGDVFTLTLELEPGEYTYKYYVDGNEWKQDPLNSLLDGDNSVLIVEEMAEDTIVLSPSILSINKGEISTLTVYATEGATISWKSSDETVATVDNGTITAKNPGKTTITATTDGGASATCTVTVMAESPVVNGNEVTFSYYDADGTIQNLSLKGTMNGWTGAAMTNTDGLFSYTTTLAPGKYAYKFHNTDLGDNGWFADPANNTVLDSDGNSLITVPGITTTSVSFKKGNTMTLPSELAYLNADGTETSKTVASYSCATEGVTITDKTITLADSFTATEFQVTATTTDEMTQVINVQIFEPSPITVKIHYDRSDDKESEWNAWVWGDFAGESDGYMFEEENGEYVATFSIPAESVYYVNTLKYKIRLGNWLKEEGERQIDLSEVVGGTVHSCVDVNGGYTTDYSDAVLGTKLKNISYDRSNKKIVVSASGVVADYENAFAAKKLDGTPLTITGVEQNGTTYTISTQEDISSLIDVTKTYKLTYDGLEYFITMPNLYKTEEFENAYTYTGNDLGATWTTAKTTFKVWAPTADSVKVQLYATGSDEEEGSKKLGTYPMTQGEKGVWTVEVDGNLDGTYYTYLTDVNGSLEESCDPYARTTGVNGERAMVINLDATDPDGWAKDVSPNKNMDYTDAVIYELHVRDLSIDDESGVKEAWQGKFLGLTQAGTTNSEGYATGLDHIIDLGVTHIHLLPSYDYASIDETMTEEEKAANPDKQFNWGYDPENYNVPEGSYSTNPYDGEVRVKEMKEMVQTLHENNINVIMDVVYNHVYDAGTFCFNEIVPNYFSRTNADGSYSNGSGCGNDTASERDMVRKYIVDSVKYWADEYHIDGFRFDLVGLLDAETINLIVDKVHETHPDVVFYGEGWTMGTAVEPADTIMATQANAYATPYFAYFSDTFRDFLKGKNDETSWGYVQNTMEGDPEGTLMSCFKANTSWIQNPTQVINYASCHDNYTLMDKINATTKSSTVADRIKMNNLAASIYMLAEGIPLVHAGEEILRTKVDNTGHIIHNSYNVPDYINSLKWDNLDNEDYRDVVDYYSGLIEFRKNHAALRLTTKADVNAYVKEEWVAENVVLFNISTSEIEDEVSDGIVVIFNSNPTEQKFSLYDKGISEGEWQICINDEDAGTDVLGTITDGNVTVPAISTLVLVKGETVDSNSVYTKNNQVTLTVDKTASMSAGKTTEIAATVNPEGSTLVWESSNESVATVEDGVVTGVSVGTSTITVSTLHGVTASCVVTVTEKVDDPEDNTGTDKPGTDTPETDKPGTDTPETDKPGTDTPETDKPGTDTPETDKPGTDTPGADKPGTDTPGADKPGTDTPETDKPGTDTPETDKPGTDTPETDKPGTDTPETDVPETDKPGTDTPETDKPGTDTPETDVPETDKPETNNPSSEKENVVYVPEKETNSKVDAELEKLIKKIEKNESVKGTISNETLSAIKEALKNNETLQTDVSIENTKADKVDNSTKDLVEKAIEDVVSDNTYAIAQYMDINLFIKTDSGDVLGTLNELSEEITLTFEIQNDLKKDGRTFGIIRVHEGKTDLLELKENSDGTYSVKTDKFSVYALFYVDKAVETDVVPPVNPGSPLTGDWYQIMPLLISTAGIMLLSKSKKESYIKK